MPSEVADLLGFVRGEMKNRRNRVEHVPFAGCVVGQEIIQYYVLQILEVRTFSRLTGL